MTTTNENETTDRVHPFERAGLGRAPFRFVGVEYKVGPIRMLDADGNPTNTMVGSPGQPMGTCDFCGQALVECCSVRSADGKTFTVGNVCIDKTRDKRIADPMKVALRKARLAKKHERDAARIARNLETIARDDVRAALAAMPSPHASRAERGETALDWTEWFLANAGTSGRIKACRVIEKAAKEVDAGTADLEAGRRAIADRDDRRQRAADAKARGEAKRAAEKQAARDASAWLIDALRAVRSTPFVDGIIEDLEDGRAVADFSPRCLDILRDIFGKTAGRGNSKTYKAKVAEFDAKIE